LAFLKTANCKISAVVIDLKNIEYAPEALKIEEGWGEDLIQRMADVLPIRDNTGGYLYIRNRAISSVEEFGQNENKDAWLYSELKKDYPTFIGAAVCCNHVNDDESKFYGIIPDSAFITSTSSRKDWFDNDAWKGKNFSEHFKYGDQSGWVENILAINKDLINLDYPGLIDDLESGKVVGTSMGTICGRSVCSICGNSATNPNEYCTHVANLRSHGLAESDNLYELNFENTFFEDSIITANTHADVHAIVLSKYAEVIPFLRALNSAEEQVRKQIRGEFVPYIKISDKVLTSKKEIESYCKELLGNACPINKESTEKMVGGRIRGHFDMGAREKDITNVERSKKNPAEIGKKYVWDSRNPVKKISSILQNVAGYFKLNEKLADDLDGAIKEILEKHSDEIGTMDAITGLVGPTSLAEPPHSYLENLEGSSIEEEEGEDFSDALRDFDPPIVWAEEQESIPEEEVEDIGEEGLEGLEGTTPREDLEEPEPEEEF